MPMSNRGAATQTPFGMTSDLGRGLAEPTKKKRSPPPPAPGPGSYDLSSTQSFPIEFKPDDNTTSSVEQIRALTRCFTASTTFRRPKPIKKYRQPTKQSKEKNGFFNSTERFPSHYNIIPGPGAYVTDPEVQLKLSRSFSAKSLSMFGNAKRRSAFDAGAPCPGPGTYVGPMTSFVDPLGDKRARTVPFSVEAKRFADKLRHDGIVTPAPHDTMVPVEWQFNQNRAPSTYSHQSVFKQELKKGASVSEDTTMQQLTKGRSAQIFKSRSTSMLVHLGPGAHDNDLYALGAQAKLTRAPASSSSFLSTSMRFGHDRWSSSPVKGKREKRMEKLYHKDVVSKIKKGDPMFKGVSTKNRMLVTR